MFSLKDTCIFLKYIMCQYMEKGVIRVLYYNWAPLEDPTRGGGVAVYIVNILNYIKQHTAVGGVNIIPTFLSSGFFYDKKNSSLRIEKSKELDIDSYYVVNSPIIAPRTQTASSISKNKSDFSTVEILDDFIIKHGPFDVIHFQSLEGLSVNVLRLKEKYPKTKFIHSWHDYGSICPSVKLWNMDGNCLYSRKKYHCGECLAAQISLPFEFYSSLRPAKIEDINKKPLLNIGLRARAKLGAIIAKFFVYSNKKFDEYRAYNIEMLNKYVDLELCVSARVAEIAIKSGVRKDIVKVDYIGTKVAEGAINKLRCDQNSENFTILYMGYATEEKGFYMLLECLEELKDKGDNIIIKLASSIQNTNLQKRLDNLKSFYKEIIVYNGYCHNDFPVIMDSVNLGIVPPLWEDNLPQVAIEMIANGIPVLTSNNGGAKELNSHPVFRFKNKTEMKEKIIKIKKNRQLLVDYWKYAPTLTTMDMHINNLLFFYK